MLGATRVEEGRAKRATAALTGVALLGCAACSSSGANAGTTDASCASSGDYAPDASFDPIYACSPPLVNAPEWTVESAGFHDAWSLMNVNALDTVYSSTVLVDHTPYLPAPSMGPQPVESGIEVLHKLIPNLDCVLDDGVRDVVAVRDADGLLVTKAVLYNVTGTYQGAPINWHGLSFTHTKLADAGDPNILVAEEVSYDDNLSFVTQLPGWCALGTADAGNTVPSGVWAPTDGGEQRYLRGVIDTKPAAEGGTGAEDFKATAQSVLQAAYGGAVSRLGELYTNDCVIDNSVFPEIDGLAAWEQYVTDVRTAFPDLTLTLDEVAYQADGTKAALHYTFTGTNTGTSPAFNFPPTGKAVTWRGVSMLYLQDGKIQKQIRIEDNLGLYYELGQVYVSGAAGQMIFPLLQISGQ
jgi:predicted ester cyclase